LGRARELAGLEFQSQRADVAAATGVATTIFTLPSVPFATYILTAGIYANDVPNYHEVALVMTQGSSVVITTLNNSNLIALSASGLNIQATQSSGASNTVRAFLTRLNLDT